MRTRALLAAVLMLLAAAPVAASCDIANTYKFDFNSQAAATLSYTGTYTYTATNGAGATKTFTTAFASNGMSSTTAGGIQMPAINALVSGAAGGRTLVVGGTLAGRTVDITSTTRNMRTTFTFNTPIRDFTVTVHDIDFSANQYRDWFAITGSNGAASYTPTVTTPAGSNNGTGARSATGSSVTLGPATTPYSLPANQAVGISTSGNTLTNVGDISVSFAQPVTSVTLHYGNYPLTTGESATGQQAYGISVLSFCPLPVLAVAKTSAPYSTTGTTRFNAPLSDVVYTLTVTNSGGSAVDLAGLVLTDLMPSQTSFYNGDFDATVPGSGPFQLSAGTSGVTLTTSNIVYSNTGGTTYVYTPTVGYDANVKAIKLAPGGSLAANSSFTIKFRARIN